MSHDRSTCSFAAAHHAIRDGLDSDARFSHLAVSFILRDHQCGLDTLTVGAGSAMSTQRVASSKPVIASIVPAYQESRRPAISRVPSGAEAFYRSVLLKRSTEAFAV